jgi:hypothetical protein
LGARGARRWMTLSRALCRLAVGLGVSAWD